jgi:CBS domain-containing protein
MTSPSSPPPEETAPVAPRFAADLMDRQHPQVRPDAVVGDVARLIVEHRVSGIPVLAESGEVVGLITEADLVARHARVHFPTYLSLFGMAIPLSTPRGARELDEETRKVVGRTASEVMTDDFGDHVVAEDTPVEDVAERLAEAGNDPLLVMRGDHLTGVITRTALVRLVVLEESGTS